LPRLILLIAIGLAAWIVYRQIAALPANQRKSAYLKVGVVLLVVVVVIATLTGRMHWLGAAITALLVGLGRLLPSMVRLFPVLQWLHGQRSAAAGPGSGNSQVETRLLRMILDHATGNLSGEVLEGEFQGRQLDELDRAQLDSLLGWCQSRDVDSARLLESYMAKRFGDSWEGEPTPPPDHGGTMSRSEALAVLGLEDDADEEAIVASHRRLMQKLHPDRGGNDYLAAKLNQAKDLLLS
jgi:hypothetical protein